MRPLAGIGMSKEQELVRSVEGTKDAGEFRRVLAMVREGLLAALAQVPIFGGLTQVRRCEKVLEGVRRFRSLVG